MSDSVNTFNRSERRKIDRVMKKAYKKKRKHALKNNSKNGKFNAKKDLKIAQPSNNDDKQVNKKETETEKKRETTDFDSFMDFYEEACLIHFLHDLEQICVNHFVIHHICGDCTCLDDEDKTDDDEDDPDDEGDFDCSEVFRELILDIDLLNINDVDTTSI